MVNVWDVASARVVAALPGTTALATASHSIAASYGYDDGEQIPRDLTLEATGRIVESTQLPVTADLEAGYGDAGDTIRRAIGLGVAGANLEDQMKPLGEAVAVVAAAVAAAEAERVPFVLNARTDALLRPGGGQDAVAEAITRGRAYVEAGARCVFVPGLLDETAVQRLVEGIGHRMVSVIGVPGSLSPARLQELGIARISYGPWPQRVALTALRDSAASLLSGGVLPDGIDALN